MSQVDTQKSKDEATTRPGVSETDKNFIQKFRERTLKIRLFLGLSSLIIGLLAAHLALFQWTERADVHYLLGEYAKYVCAYGGFLAMISGAMLVNDYFSHKSIFKKKRNSSTLSPRYLKEKNVSERIVRNRLRNLRRVLISMPSVISLFILLPTAFSVISYTATVHITIKSTPIYYFHRIDLSQVTPPGKLMDTALPSLNQSETLYELLRGETVYFYSPMLPQSTIVNGTWLLYLWASTASAGKVSRLTVQIHVVSADGTIEKAVIGSLTDVVIDYGYSERMIPITGSYANISSTDRIRLTLHAQTGSENDSKGLKFYYDGYGAHQTLYHETRLEPP